MIHKTEFCIRTFHTDAFGHINNARYLELLEEARWQFAEKIGLIPLLRSSQLGFIIMDLKIRFRLPVTEGDRIWVSTQLVSLGSASGEVLQKVTVGQDSKMATRCMSHFILIDRCDNKSVPIEGEIRDCLLEIMAPEGSKLVG